MSSLDSFKRICFVMHKQNHLCFIFTFFYLEHSRPGYSLMKKEGEEKEECGQSEDKEDETELQ